MKRVSKVKQIDLSDSRQRSITNNYMKSPLGPSNKQTVVRSASKPKIQTSPRVQIKCLPVAISSTSSSHMMSTDNKSSVKKEVTKTFSKLGKIKIDLNTTNSKSSSSVNNNQKLKNLMSSKKSDKSCDKPKSKQLSPVIKKAPQAQLTKVKSSQILGQILPDFANIDSTQENSSWYTPRDTVKYTETSETHNQIQSKNIRYMVLDMHLELPELDQSVLKSTSLNVQEFLVERAALANKIAYTFRVKKKIPPTTPEYYKVCYVIGRGAFAKVCLGVQVLTGAQVAMKIIEKSSLKSENAKKRIIQEIMILKQLSQYPMIIKLYEVFETKKQIFIIMEYIKDGDLMKHLKDNGGSLSEEQSKTIFTQLISIMAMLQKHSILHRDIKLDNLLMNSRHQVKVCDFGVSKVIVKGQRITDQCGTPAYLAPEILCNKGGYEGFASDIWSLGVVLYIMIVGKVPFKGNNMNELNQNIQSGHLNFMEMKQTGITTECMELIRKMLITNPKSRITLNEIMDHPWLKNDPTMARHLQRVTDVNLKKQQNLDPKLLFQIEQLGFQKEYIHKSLQKMSLCHINALYVALQNK